MKRLNGIHVKHHKNTENCETKQFTLPARLTVLMSQAMGAPCTPLVKKGDTVDKGQKIGDSDAFMSAPVHSPTSGTVADVTDYLLPNGTRCKAVIIEPDGENRISPNVKPPVINGREDFVNAVRESGCVGLGGAGFPTHIKLRYDPVKTPIDTLVINGAECEPYITSDYREFVENPDDVIDGIAKIMELMNIPMCKIGIEENKPSAIKLMTEKTANMKGVSVVTLPSSYPQGAEKVLIHSCTGRIVAEGELPSNQGVVVMNVSTVGFISRYLKTGMPLTEKRLTLDGNAATKNQGNYIVPIGTAVSELLSFCGAENPEKVLYGGPMMGFPLYDTEQVVTKVNNAVLAFKDVKTPETTACIRCGRCIRACPLNLMPTLLEQAYDRRDSAELARLKVNLCMNCGCCSYVCPANRHLAEKNQLAKALLPKPKK